MKQYNRAKQKRLNLQSVEYYTNTDGDEESASATRKNKRGHVLADRNNDGEGQGYASGSGSSDRSPEVQHQQGDETEGTGEHRVSAEDGRKFGSRSGTKAISKDIGNAA